MAEPGPENRRPGGGSREREGAASRQEPDVWRLAGVGLELAGTTAVLTLGGWWLDGVLGTEPWLLVVGVTIGVVGGMYKLYRVGKRYF